MKVTKDMKLMDLMDRMGDATISDAMRLRRRLVEEFEGKDTAEIPCETWYEMLEAAQFDY